MAQTNRLQRRKTSSADSKKSDLQQTLRKGKNGIEEPLHRVFLGSTRNVWKKRVRAIAEKPDTVFTVVNWTVGAVLVTTPIVAMLLCTANEWVVKGKKFWDGIGAGFNDMIGIIKPIIKGTAGDHLVATVAVIVGYIGLNAALKGFKSMVAEWEAQRQNKQQ